MPDLETVQVYTVPSTWVSSFNKPLGQAYRRIVGIGCLNGASDIQWARVIPDFDESEYRPVDTELELLNLPKLSAKRLGSFFNRYFVQPLSTDSQPVSMVDEISDDSYNCHRFGYWMRGRVAATQTALPEAPDDIALDGIEVTGFLPAGSHGVYGARDLSSNAGAAFHSVVGLGTEHDECLQVLASGGFLGIDKYDNVLDFYGPQAPGQVKLYTI